jgi:hypothetical protein
MTGEDLRAARATLGQLWGLGRPVSMAEMGRVVGLGGRDPGESIRDYERGKTMISNPLALALAALLDGWRPADLEARLKP